MVRRIVTLAAALTAVALVAPTAASARTQALTVPYTIAAGEDTTNVYFDLPAGGIIRDWDVIADAGNPDRAWIFVAPFPITPEFSSVDYAPYLVEVVDLPTTHPRRLGRFDAGSVVTVQVEDISSANGGSGTVSLRVRA